LQADKKILPVLEDMGNIITSDKNSITIVGKGIKPVTVDMIDFPDQAQTLAVTAAFADGKSVLIGLESLHVKETDRLKATAEELDRMNVDTQTTYDSLVVHGGKSVKANTIDTYGDQRMAMAFAVAGAVMQDITINDPDVVNKTFPAFWSKLKEIGIGVKEVA
jgi:3-phosphoshikimate 1-carboxyvinyltransferase